jgi:Uma2 family endonuclease
MSTYTPPVAAPEVDYPDDDGLPMADNTLQYRWIVTIQGGLDALFRDDPDVFVAGNLLWYPVEGDNKTRLAPDVMVAFGRPKDDYRGSYRQWVEGGVAPQVVFEVLSPSNDAPEMESKLRFYERHGVEEYYEYDPDHVALRGWLRQGGSLAEIPRTSGWTSPRLGIRFELGDDLTVFRPDGRPFVTYREIDQQREESERRAIEERRRADEEHRLRAESDRLRAESDRRAQEERLRAQEERLLRDESDRRAERLAARLRELGLDPDE